MALRLAQDSHRHGAVRSGPVPALSEGVIAPAVHRPRRSEGAGMHPACADRGEAEPARDARGGGATVDTAATVTELVFRIPPPAVRRPARRERTAVILAASQRDEREPTGHGRGDRSQGHRPELQSLADVVCPLLLEHTDSETAGMKA